MEAAHKGESGVEIDVSRVPCREEGMTSYEIMLSESQERMLAIVRRGAEEEVEAIFSRWGLHSAVVGSVTDDGIVRVRNGSEIVAEISRPSACGRADICAGRGRSRPICRKRTVSN